MIKMERNEAPEFLQINWKKWTKKYIETDKWNTNWYGKQKELLSNLKLLTNNHCAFCDDLLYPFVREIGQINY